jgi:hypothetical protein
VLFSLDEFAAYLPLPRGALNDGRALLLHDLAVGEIERLIGALSDPPPQYVRAVAFEVVARAYRNPDGFQSESVDDWTGRREAGAAGVYLTEPERLRIRQGVLAPKATSSVQLVAYPETTSSTLPTA